MPPSDVERKRGREFEDEIREMFKKEMQTLQTAMRAGFQGVTDQVVAVESRLGSQLNQVGNEVREMKTEFANLKQEQQHQAEQVQYVRGDAVQQAFAFMSDKKQSFFSGARKQTVIITGAGLTSKEAVLETVLQALVKAGCECSMEQLQEQLYDFRQLPGGPEKRVFFKVRNVREAEQVWAAKKHLGDKVFLSVDLTPLERTNKTKLSKHAAFKVAKETAVAKKLHHGWILDEYFIVWELEGKKQKVLYHVKYPMGLLPNGDAAPPNTYVAAAAAAGLC